MCVFVFMNLLGMFTNVSYSPLPCMINLSSNEQFPCFLGNLKDILCALSYIAVDILYLINSHY